MGFTLRSSLKVGYRIYIHIYIYIYIYIYLYIYIYIYIYVCVCVCVCVCVYIFYIKTGHLFFTKLKYTNLPNKNLGQIG